MKKKEKLSLESTYLKASGNETISVEVITPDIAREMLKKNTNNRRMKVYSKNKYSRDMKNGKWAFNGSTICITEDEVLGDGQTRLQACIDSGTPFETIVVRNLKRDAVKTIDLGNPKSVADHLKIDGIKYSTNVAATAKKVMSAEDRKSTKTISYSYNEIFEEITRKDRAEYYEKAAKFAEYIYKESKLLTKSYVSTAYVRLRILSHPEESILEFFNQFIDQKPACGVIRSLRKEITLGINKKTGKTITSKDKFNLLILAWNEFKRGNLNNKVKIVDLEKDLIEDFE